MPLTLITGQVGSGKTEAVLGRLKSYTNRQAGLCIVPSDAVSFELRKKFLRDKKAVLGDVFIAYNHFIRKIAAVDSPVISQGEQILLLHKIAAENPLSYFKSASVGIARQAAEVITALKKNLVTSAKLRDMLRAHKAQREEDLLKLFELYEAEKESLCLLDEGDLALLAAKKIKTSPLFQGIEYIAFDEFHHFSPGQLNLIGSLAGDFGRMKIEVTFPVSGKEDELFAPYLEKNLKALKEIASDTIALKGKDLKSSDIRNVVLRSPFQETRFVAHEIATAVQNGISPDEITVCVRKNDQRLPILLKELERMGLASRTHRIGTIFSSPVMHESFSGDSTFKLPESATFDEFANLVTDRLKHMHDKAALEQETGESSSRSIISLYSTQQILSSLATASKLLSLGRIPRETFLNILFHNCLSFFVSSNEISEVTPVNVAFFEDGLAHSPKLLFIPHLIEGNIPSSFSDRLFFSSEGGANEKFSDIFPTPSDCLGQESFLFHRLITKTKGKAVLCHPAIDYSGGEAAASSFLDRFDDPTPVDSPAMGEITGLQKNIIAIEQERMIRAAAHPQYQGRLSGEKVRTMIRKRYTENAISPSQIEAYATCPFKFFVQYVLNLRPPEEITPELQPKDMGTIIHAILERFYRDHLDVFKRFAGGQLGRDSVEKTLDKVVEQVFDEHAKLIGYVVPGLRPFERKSARALALQVIMNEAEECGQLPEPLFPASCEWAFGATPETMLHINVDGQADALIRGRVDRIDQSEDKSKFTVVDYKTGRQVDPVANKIKKGLHFQLPLYIEAVKRFLFPKSNALGGVIFAVRQPEKKHGFLKKSFNDINYSVGKRSSSILEDDAWEELLNISVAGAAKYVAAIREADFSVEPRDCPRYCDYEDVCRYSGKTADSVTASGD